MKPQNEFEKNVVSASANLPSLTDRQLQWGLDNSIQYVARYNKQKYTCTKCGHQWQSDTKKNYVKCPHCGTRLLVHEGLKKVYNETAYFTVMTACEGYQVMRSVVVRCTMKVGSPAVYDWAEVMQRWIAADGTYVNFARLRQTFNTMYFDLWLFRTALILRQRNAIYDRIYSGTVCPYMSIIPELRRRGLKRSLYRHFSFNLIVGLLRNSKIETLLNDKNIPNEIKIRTKNIYGIYKRLNEGHKLSDIHDLLALKIMVDEVENCYRTLYLIHNEYHPINDKFKDYICNPKTNMYQSLHTTVFGPDDRLVQTQIRTFDMDKIASFGLSTYWDIEKGNAREVMQKDLSGKYQFFNSLVEINKVFGDNKEFINQVKNELFSNKIYVYTTKGEIMELPKGASVIDFAYKIHTDVGNTMVAAQVNNEYVDVMTELKNKDRVKIIIDDLSYGPREDWEDKAVTTYAKRKIREFNRR